MTETTTIGNVFFYMTASTLPFHLFAYIPFWNHLRLSKKITFIILAAEQIIFTALFFFIYHLCYSIGAAQLIFIPLYGGMFFYLVKIEPGKIAFLYLFTTDYLLLIKGAAVYFSQYLLHLEPVGWQSGMLILLLFFVTMPMMLHYINHTAEIVFSINAPEIWHTAWLLPLLNSFIVLLFTYPAEISNMRTLIARTVLMLCMFIMYRILIRSIKQVQNQAAAEEYSRSMESLIKIQADQYTLMQSRIEESRQARHDLRYHWKALNGYVEDKDFAGLTSYIKKYCESLPQESHISFCSNPAVNAILHFYADKAAKYEIETEISFAVKDTTVIPEPELCVLLGNLLENALEACIACTGKRFIRVNARLAGEHTLILAVDNTGAKPALEGNVFYSSKRPGFGIGTESVRVIVKRYQGDVRFEWKDGVFYASVLLNL